MPIKRDDPKVREPQWRIEPYGPGDKVIRIAGPNNFYPMQHVAEVLYDDIDHDQQEAHARTIVGHMNGELCGGTDQERAAIIALGKKLLIQLYKQRGVPTTDADFMRLLDAGIRERGAVAETEGA